MKPVAPSDIPIIPNVSILGSFIKPCLASVSIFFVCANTSFVPNQTILAAPGHAAHARH